MVWPTCMLAGKVDGGLDSQIFDEIDLAVLQHVDWRTTIVNVGRSFSLVGQRTVAGDISLPNTFAAHIACYDNRAIVDKRAGNSEIVSAYGKAYVLVNLNNLVAGIQGTGGVGKISGNTNFGYAAVSQCGCKLCAGDNIHFTAFGKRNHRAKQQRNAQGKQPAKLSRFHFRSSIPSTQK